MSASIASLCLGLALGMALGAAIAVALGGGWGYSRGERVWWRKYDASDWERGTVVAVSWRGAACIRPDDGRRGVWVDRARARTHVRRGTWRS